MNQEVKKAWIEALRSGEYKQTTGRLRRGDSYCCLGVLCDLYIKNNPDYVWAGGGDYRYFASCRDDAETGAMSMFLAFNFLHGEVVKWAGLSSENPHYDDDGTLSDLNDSGSSFEEIADVIEKHL